MSTADYTVIHLPESGSHMTEPVGGKASGGKASGGHGQVGYISLFRPLSLVWRLCSYLKRRTNAFDDAFDDTALEAALPIGTGTWQ
jgi:hypothetical protein